LNQTVIASRKVHSPFPSKKRPRPIFGLKPPGNRLRDK
jgi:hypothetical protein